MTEWIQLKTMASTVWYRDCKEHSPYRKETQCYKHRIDRQMLLNHSKTFAQRQVGQRGGSRISQTFLVAFPYTTAVSETEIQGLLAELPTHGLQGLYERCLFRGIPAFRILIIDSEVQLEEAITYARYINK